MSKAKPGPWTAWNRGIGWEVHHADARPVNDGFRETFTEADARLIAAAPDLLSALKALKAAYENLDDAALSAWEVAEAAIAKAEGPQ